MLGFDTSSLSTYTSGNRRTRAACVPRVQELFPAVHSRIARFGRYNDVRGSQRSLLFLELK
jgi:hypothetical protein